MGQSSESPLSHQMFLGSTPGAGGLAPGRRGCESCHTHTTRLQIILDTILQPQGRRLTPKKTPRKTLTRDWNGVIGGGAGTRRALVLPRGGVRARCP